MTRALINAPFTLRTTIYAGSSAEDPSPDSATIQVLRADGTVVIPPGTGASNDGTGGFTYTLSSAEMSQLDLLQTYWTVTLGGHTSTFVTYTEVVGGFLCPLSLLKSLYPSETDDVLAERRTQLEIRLERALRYALVPRYSRERHIPRRNSTHLYWPYVRNIREVRDNAGTWSGSYVSGLQYNSLTGQIYYLPQPGFAGASIIVGYEHGDDYSEVDVTRAMELLAQETYGTSLGATDPRVVRREADGQAITYASPSLSGGAFLTPELNRMVRGSRRVLVR